MAEVKQWITVNGQHIPIMEGQTKAEAVKKAISKQANDDADKKEKQIATNKKEADKKNDKLPEGFEERAEEYVGGGIDIDDVFEKKDLDYIRSHQTETNKPLYRVEDSKFTFDKIQKQQLDSKNFKFTGSFRSFSRDFDVMNRSIDEDSDEWGGFQHPVIFQTVGHTKQFDMEPYTKEYAKQFASQSESLVGGNFTVVGIQRVKVAGKTVPLIKIAQEK